MKVKHCKKKVYKGCLSQNPRRLPKQIRKGIHKDRKPYSTNVKFSKRCKKDEVINTFEWLIGKGATEFTLDYRKGQGGAEGGQPYIYKTAVGHAIVMRRQVSVQHTFYLCSMLVTL